MNKFKSDVIYVMYSECCDLIYLCVKTKRFWPWLKGKQRCAFEAFGATYNGNTCYEVSPRSDVKLGVL